MNAAVNKRTENRTRNVFNLGLLSLFLTGCSVLPEKEPQLSVYANGRPSGTVWATARYPNTDQKVVGGTVVMKDEMGTVRQEGVFGEKGTIIFRYPGNASHVDIVVTAPDGMTGEKRVERHEVYRELSCRLPTGC